MPWLRPTATLKCVSTAALTLKQLVNNNLKGVGKLATMTAPQQVQQLDQCINECKNIVSELQNLTQRVNNTELQSTLKESIHHLEMCMHECQYATKATS